MTRCWAAMTRDNISRRASISFGVIARVAGELGALGVTFFAGVAENTALAKHSVARKNRKCIKVGKEATPLRKSP